MSFINEFISDEDADNYQLKQIDEKFISNGTNARDWTIDRDRSIYLRNVAIGSGAEPELRNRTLWTFYWQGDLLNLRLDLLAGTGGRGEPGWSHWLLVWLNGSNGLPAHLRSKKDEVIRDLEEALVAYKDFGVYSKNTEYTITLDISEECVL